MAGMAFYDISEFSPSLESAHLVGRQDASDLENAASGSTNLAQLSQNGNMSSREYGAYVYSLNKSDTGCNRQGALPVPLAANDTCLPGWYCEYTHSYVMSTGAMS